MHDGQVELREESSGKLVLRGFASVAERWYPVGGIFEEKVRRGTWRRSLAEGPDTVLLEDHSGLGLARTKTPSGEPTLLLSEDSRGNLCVEAFLDARAPRVQDLRSTAENCGLQMSVAFRCSQDKWNEDRSRRELKEASIHRGDVTVCNFGANEAAAATISERGERGEQERRTYAESLKGATERRMCPVEGFELRETPTLTVALKPVRSYLPIARARRARLRAGSRRAHPGSDASVDGVEDSPRYTQAEIDAAGEAGLAFKGRSGKYSYPIKDKRDLMNALAAFRLGRFAPADKADLRRYIIRRAVVMGLAEQLPSGWAHPVAKPGPTETPDNFKSDSGESSSVAGQSQ